MSGAVTTLANLLRDGFSARSDIEKSLVAALCEPIARRLNESVGNDPLRAHDVLAGAALGVAEVIAAMHDMSECDCNACRAFAELTSSHANGCALLAEGLQMYHDTLVETSIIDALNDDPDLGRESRNT